MSSLARKNGYRPLSSDRNITPADHISTAEKKIEHKCASAKLLKVKL